MYTFFYYYVFKAKIFIHILSPVLFTIYAKKNENFTEMMYKISKTIVFIHIFQIYEEKKKELIEIIHNFINHNMNQSSNISCTIPGRKQMEIFLACDRKKYSIVKKHVDRAQTLQQYDFQY